MCSDCPLLVALVETCGQPMGVQLVNSHLTNKANDSNDLVELAQQIQMVRLFKLIWSGHSDSFGNAVQTYNVVQWHYLKSNYVDSTLSTDCFITVSLSDISTQKTRIFVCEHVSKWLKLKRKWIWERMSCSKNSEVFKKFPKRYFNLQS